MICPNCGKEAADGALFCTGCGGRLDNLPKQEKMTASENSKILHELETEMPDVQIGKVNVDEQMDLARQFRVVSIPTLIIFKNGQEVQRMVGVTSKEELKDALK